VVKLGTEAEEGGGVARFTVTAGICVMPFESDGIIGLASEPNEEGNDWFKMEDNP